MEDKDFVSNEYHEVVYLAEKLGVAPSEIYRAKENTGSNKREVIINYINGKNAEESEID